MPGQLPSYLRRESGRQLPQLVVRTRRPSSGRAGQYLRFEFGRLKPRGLRRWREWTHHHSASGKVSDLDHGGISTLIFVSRSRELLPDESLTTEGGASASMPHDIARDTNPPFDTPAALDSCTQALQRLISHAAPQDEFPSLLEAVFSGGEIVEMIEGLHGEHIQTLIDVIDVVCHQTPLPPEVGN